MRAAFRNCAGSSSIEAVDFRLVLAGRDNALFPQFIEAPQVRVQHVLLPLADRLWTRFRGRSHPHPTKITRSPVPASISPIFTADSVTITVSREKDGKLRIVKAGWDDYNWAPLPTRRPVQP